MSEVTHILESIQQGAPKAADELLPLVYGELRRLAAHKMTGESPGHTLQPTALVHEAWLRLVGDPSSKFQNRAHFFGAAAEAMRRILVESARRKKRLKHGGYLTMTITRQQGVSYEVQSAGTLLPLVVHTGVFADGHRKVAALVHRQRRGGGISTTLKVRDNVLTGTRSARFLRTKVTAAP